MDTDLRQVFRPAPRVEDLLQPRSDRRLRGRRLLFWFVLVPGAVAVVLALVGAGTGYGYGEFAPAQIETGVELPENTADLQRFVARQKKKLGQIEKQLAALQPDETFIVVDQTQNRLYLRKGDEVLLEARCSAGSGMVLRENPDFAKSKGRSPREWHFDTPRGAYKVKRRVEDPVWTKPDWDRVENAKIPTGRDDYYDDATLGEYALHLGDGYMIHGTLYERLLGRSVTHGCIRLGRDDLRRVWKETKLGTRVFIY